MPEALHDIEDEVARMGVCHMGKCMNGISLQLQNGVKVKSSAAMHRERSTAGHGDDA